MTNLPVVATVPGTNEKLPHLNSNRTEFAARDGITRNEFSNHKAGAG